MVGFWFECKGPVRRPFFISGPKAGRGLKISLRDILPETLKLLLADSSLFYKQMFQEQVRIDAQLCNSKTSLWRHLVRG